MPVPDLCQTVSRYLASLRAVLAPMNEGSAASKILLDKRHLRAESQSDLSEEKHTERRRQFEHTERIVRHFMLNEGPRLQHDLKEHANKCQNWVSSLLSAVNQPTSQCPFVSRSVVRSFGQSAGG